MVMVVFPRSDGVHMILEAWSLPSVRTRRVRAGSIFSIVCLLTAAACSRSEAPQPSTPGLDAGMVDAHIAPIDDGGAPITPADSGPSECPLGQRYGDRCVEVATPDCQVDSDCTSPNRCSQSGRCTQLDCLAHTDCSDQERCREGICLPRIEQATGVQFERVYPEALVDHNSLALNRSFIRVGGTGFGLALLDIDGDLDLDLFVGSEGGSPPCLYENKSKPSFIQFEPIGPSCQAEEVDWHGATSIDLQGDGLHELVRLAAGSVVLETFYPQAQRIELLDQFEPDDPRRSCNAGSALAHDFNYDGRVDLMIGCHFDMFYGTYEDFRNLVFLQTPSGALEFLTQDAWQRGDPIVHTYTGSTLALGLADLNDDGLGDIMVSEDDLAREIIDDPAPGATYFACAPDEPCRFRLDLFAKANERSGAFMGTAVLRLANRDEHYVYVTDRFDNRLLRQAETGSVDVAGRLNVGMGYLGQTTIYSWGVVVDDFDFDGRDDLYVGNGAVPDQVPSAFAEHLDVVLLQKEPGSFRWHSSDIGVPPHTTIDSGHEDRAYSTRAVLKADLDSDGMMDLMTSAMEGHVRVLREVPLTNSNNSRCTLVPMPRYVPGHGSQHRLHFDDDPKSRLWDSQGQVRSGTSPYILTPKPEGTLEFPSGARVRFACEESHRPTIVFEPIWLTLSRDNDRVHIRVTEHAPPGELAVFIEAESLIEATREGDQHWSIPAPAVQTPMMLRFGDRWTARWWPTP